jgi:polyhydroxyalkanoate synthase subunit PhaC
MDLIPKPDQVVAAASNVVRQVVTGGIADLRAMPRSLVDARPGGEVHHYDPLPGVPPVGHPVLLVPSPGVPAGVFDLRRGGSLVEHLLAQGRPTYVLEYGDVDVRDRELTLEPWVDDVLPTAVEAVSAHTGRRPVHLLGWSLGGVLALLAAAGRPGLPLASLTAAGAPTDVSQVPLMAPRRPLVTESPLPIPLLGRVLRLPPVEHLVDRPLAVALHLDDTDYLAQLEAVGRLTAEMDAYRGRSYGQLLHLFAPGNALAEGAVELGGRSVALATVAAPVLLLAGATDDIATVGAVRAAAPYLTGSPEVQVEIVPGGHLGLITGRGARTGTWPVLDEWFDRWTSAPRTKPRKQQSKPRKKAAGKDEIGSNPRRRYGSGGSRALSR